MQQLINVAQLPIVHGHIAAMPDVHAGIGATVGSVIPTKGAIIPAAVGVDIGCGMNAVRLTLTRRPVADSLAPRPQRHRGWRAGRLRTARLRQGARQCACSARRASCRDRLDGIVGKHPGVIKMQRQFARTWISQLGTLGGGNHFIELCLDEAQRGVGDAALRFARHRQRARPLLHRRRAQGHGAPPAAPARPRPGVLSARARRCSTTTSRRCEWAQDYACANRREMMRSVVEALAPHLPPFQTSGEAINCHHNYVAQEAALRRARVRHPQGRHQRARRRAGHHPRQHGREVVHRARPRQRRSRSARARTAPAGA